MVKPQMMLFLKNLKLFNAMQLQRLWEQEKVHCIKSQGQNIFNKEDGWDAFACFTKLFQLNYQHISAMLFLQ